MIISLNEDTMYLSYMQFYMFCSGFGPVACENIYGKSQQPTNCLYDEDCSADEMRWAFWQGVLSINHRPTSTTSLATMSRLAPTTHTVFEGPQSGAISERSLTTCTSQTQPTKSFNYNGIEYIIIILSTHFWHNKHLKQGLE